MFAEQVHRRELVHFGHGGARFRHGQRGFSRSRTSAAAACSAAQDATVDHERGHGVQIDALGDGLRCGRVLLSRNQRCRNGQSRQDNPCPHRFRTAKPGETNVSGVPAGLAARPVTVSRCDRRVMVRPAASNSAARSETRKGSRFLRLERSSASNCRAAFGVGARADRPRFRRERVCSAGPCTSGARPRSAPAFRPR